MTPQPIPGIWWHPWHRRWSISMVLSGVFGGLTAGSLLLVLLISSLNATGITARLWIESADHLLDRVDTQVSALLDPVAAASNRLALLLARSNIDIRNNDEIETFIAGVLAPLPQAYGVALLADGEPIRWFPQEGSTEKPPINDAGMETDTRHLWQAARSQAEGVWLRPSWVPELGAALVGYAQVLTPPAGTPEQLVVIGVSLHSLSEMLQHQNASDGTSTWLIDREGGVIAHPVLADGAWSFAGGQLPTVEALARAAGVPERRIADLDRYFVGHKIKAVPGTPDEMDRYQDISVVTTSGELSVSRPLPGYGPVGWHAVVQRPTSEATAAFAQIWRTVLIAGGVAVAVIIVALVLARMTARPIKRLAAAVERFDAEHEFMPVASSRLKELDQAITAFNTMAESTLERERMRALFGKYVPEAIAQALLNDADAARPREAEATVLFVDLEGFTNLATRLSPVAVVEVLNAYFSAVVSVLERHGGVVTQFQGDAILATFNVPMPDVDHARAAVTAAAEITDLVETETFSGHKLRCRIGVNTGAVVAGSVGAEGRLNYTVHGDAVNVAARLEQLNKQLGTRVLVAARTAAAQPDAAVVALGEVPIRGRDMVEPVFTLPGMTPSAMLVE